MNSRSLGMGMFLMLAVLCLTLAPPLAAQSGADLFKQKCAMCHGPDGKGQTAMGKNLKLRDLASPEVQKMTDAQFKEILDKGKGKMQPQKLTPAQDTEVVKFMRSLKK
jgi:mono/diheme cytochrome c family protein